MAAPAIHDVRVFVPTRAFAVSRAFYLALGGRLIWAEGGLAAAHG